MVGCSVDGCCRPHDARGYCSMHRQRFMRYGDPLRENVTASDGAPAAFIEKAVGWRGNACLIWPFSRDKRGSARIATLKPDGRKVPAHVCRLVCERVKGKPPTRKHEAAHTCGNGHLGCVSGKHLVWKTHAENQRDMIAHGTSLRGEKQPTSKLTARDVLKIRKLIASNKFTLTAIAGQFGVDPETIGNIKSGKRWGWLKSDGEN